MKKLIVAMVGALLTTVASAATADWSVYETYAMGTEDYAQNYLVYFVDAATLSKADAIAAISMKDFSVLTNAYQADELLADGEGYALQAGTWDSGVSIDGYAIVFNAESTDSATYFYVSDSVTGKTGGSGQSAALDIDATSSADAANWTSLQAVPEPTSGLLLLLGMGALALRRKQA